MLNLEKFLEDHSDVADYLTDRVCETFGNCESCPFNEKESQCKDLILDWLLKEYNPIFIVMSRLKKNYPIVEKKIHEFKKAFTDCSVFTYNMTCVESKRDDAIILTSIESYLMGLENCEIIDAEEVSLLKNYIIGGNK